MHYASDVVTYSVVVIEKCSMLLPIVVVVVVCFFAFVFEDSVITYSRQYF